MCRALLTGADRCQPRRTSVTNRSASAGTGLAITMVGAAIFHIRRGDPAASVAPSVVLGILSVVVAVGRFGPEAF